MSIRPIVLNGMIQRTDDVGQLKMHEDQKPMADQQAIQGQVDKKEQALTHQVTNPNQKEAMENHADAREEGKNKYKPLRKKKNANGRVIKKTPEEGGFDFKI